MGSNPVAELRHIHKVYGSGDTEVRAVNDLNLTVEAGDYIAVMGASGSGKSTAMNILGCLDRPSSGSYLLQGQQVDGLSDDALAILRNRCLGFVFQQFHLLAHLSALENVELPMIYANVPAEERRRRATEALHRVGLGQRLNNRPNQLSGGQQQRDQAWLGDLQPRRQLDPLATGNNLVADRGRGSNGHFSHDAKQVMEQAARRRQPPRRWRSTTPPPVGGQR